MKLDYPASLSCRSTSTTHFPFLETLQVCVGKTRNEIEFLVRSEIKRIELFQWLHLLSYPESRMSEEMMIMIFVHY